MAFVPGYKNDIFVSYAHVDDALLGGETKGWVTLLIENLETRLAQKLARRENFKLWMDYQLSGHTAITAQIIEALQQSAILLLVQSPGYVGSEWCKREENTFLELVRQRRGDEVFIVEREPVGEEESLPELKRLDLRGYPFWVKEKPGAHPRLLSLPRDEDAYMDKLNDLCSELCDELHVLRKRAVGGAVPGPVPSTEVPSVFLAQVTDDLEPDRDAVRRYLKQMGINVLPVTWYSQDPTVFKKSAEQDLAKCQVFAQLISEFPGKKPPDLPCGYVQLQIDLAKSVTDPRPMPILQWRRPSLSVADVPDPDHRKLLEASTVHAESIEDFKSEIRAKAFEKPQAPVIEKERGPSVSAFVFVDMETSDRTLAKQVCALLDEYRVDYVLPIQATDARAARKDLERNLRECDAVVVVYGTTTAEWVKAQLLACRKSLASRPRPLKALALFDGPPDEPNKLDRLGVKMHTVQVLNCRQGLDRSQLEAFLKTVESEAA